jgi:hypothetical protein
MLPTIVRGRAFRIITWRHSTSRWLPLSAIGGCICGSRLRVNIKILNTIPIKIWWQKGTIIIDEGYFVIYHWFHIKMYKSSGYNTESPTADNSRQHIWRISHSMHFKDLFGLFEKDPIVAATQNWHVDPYPILYTPVLKRKLWKPRGTMNCLS